MSQIDRGTTDSLEEHQFRVNGTAGGDRPGGVVSCAHSGSDARWVHCSIRSPCLATWPGWERSVCGACSGRASRKTSRTDYQWDDARPLKGDELRSIGDRAISEQSYVGYSDYIRAMRDLRHRVGETIEVRWRDQARLGRSTRRRWSCRSLPARRISGPASGSSRSC